MTLLPANATAFEIALEHALELITEIPNPIDTLWDPAHCPVQFLPWLAWQYSVDYWRPDWSETVKRQVIASAYEVHRIKGTLPAIKQGIAGLGIEADIVRWFDTEPKGEPYTMTVTIKHNGDVMTDQIQRDAAEMLDATKALRTDAQLRVGVDPAAMMAFTSRAAPRQSLSATTPAQARDHAAAGMGCTARAAPHHGLTATTPAASRDQAVAAFALAGGGHAAPRLHAIVRTSTS